MILVLTFSSWYILAISPVNSDLLLLISIRQPTTISEPNRRSLGKEPHLYTMEFIRTRRNIHLLASRCSILQRGRLWRSWLGITSSLHIWNASLEESMRFSQIRSCVRIPRYSSASHPSRTLLGAATRLGAHSLVSTLAFFPDCSTGCRKPLEEDAVTTANSG